MTITRKYLIVILFLLLAVGITGFFYWRNRSIKIVIEENHGDFQLAWGGNKQLIESYVKEWKLGDKDGAYIFNEDYKGFSQNKITKIVIQPVEEVQALGWVNKSGTKKVISYSHKYENNTLYLKINIDKVFFDLSDNKNEKFQLVSAGIVNALFTVTHPTPKYVPEQNQSMIKTNNENIRKAEPIFVY